jgi:chemotaxis protein MotB
MKGRRRPRREALVAHDRWLISYADFITLLFALFVVLFAASRHSNQALERVARAIHSGFRSMGAAPGPAQHVFDEHSPSATVMASAPYSDPGMAALQQQLAGSLSTSLASGEIAVHQTPQGLVISLRELGFFDSGEAVLLPGAAQKIERVGRILRSRGLSLRVEGHSDNQPINNANFHSNWELSAARAMTVLLLLVDEAHYDPTRIAMAGYGPYRPVADDATSAGRRLNRRVDLVVLDAHAATEPSEPVQAR